MNAKSIHSPKEIMLVAHDIRSAHNVGSFFRTADAAGFSHIHISGYTPRPIDRFGRTQSDIAKTALGGELSVQWSESKEIIPLLVDLKEKGFYLIALEQDERSIDYKSVSVEDKNKVAFIVGNEVTGIDKEVLDLCDCIAVIPQKGVKESLNVSVAFGVGVFRILGL